MNAALRQGFELGMRHAVALTLGRFGAVVLAVALGWTALLARLSRLAAPTHATTHALVGPVFGIAIPIALFVYCGHLIQARPRETTHTMAALGASRSAFSAGLLFAVFSSAGAFAVVLSTASSLLIRGFGDATDFVTTVWISLLGGACYAACFLGVSLLLGKVGAFAFLFLDWTLGSSAHLWGWPWPRAHVTNLLGGPSSLPASSTASAAVLWLLLALGSGLCILALARSFARPPLANLGPDE